ncbi:unnamed protein product [Oppiella nova]|uniref:Myb-like domain-containing protein n=1 Tax=Oppiella nova TaxID=334625 RepID=A0A7R9QS62_9ACAR|nr:unnamed protein product [Oppiella nova]CAG2172375.1 unnamed protein product [Oppiella nova]
MSDSCGKSDEELTEEFIRLQLELRDKLVVCDTEDWALDMNKLELIGGLDISYDKSDSSRGCVTCVVLNAKNDFEIVYKNNTFIEPINRYIAGFLAFHWKEVSKQMGDRSEWQCQRHFRTKVYYVMSNGDMDRLNRWSVNHSRQLVYFLHRSSYENELQIDWDFLKDKFSDVCTFRTMCRNWYNLKAKVHDYNLKTYPEIVDSLYKRYVGPNDDVEELEEFCKS